MPDVHLIETPAHGRVLVEKATRGDAPGWLVTFHGYAQSADDALADARAIPGADAWTIASVQALNRFYSRGDEKVLANWMTRQDREVAIADNIEYVDRAIDALGVRRTDPPGADRTAVHLEPIVFVGFSQGAAMAYRAAAFGRHRASGVIALGGDIPPEIKAAPNVTLPPVLIGAGDAETWYTAAKVDADAGFLASRGITHDVVRYRGGHLWTDEFRAAAGRWLAGKTSGLDG